MQWLFDEKSTQSFVFQQHLNRFPQFQGGDGAITSWSCDPAHFGDSGSWRDHEVRHRAWTGGLLACRLLQPEGQSVQGEEQLCHLVRRSNKQQKRISAGSWRLELTQQQSHSKLYLLHYHDGICVSSIDVKLYGNQLSVSQTSFYPHQQCFFSHTHKIQISLHATGEKSQSDWADIAKWNLTWIDEEIFGLLSFHKSWPNYFNTQF